MCLLGETSCTILSYHDYSFVKPTNEMVVVPSSYRCLTVDERCNATVLFAIDGIKKTGLL